MKSSILTRIWAAGLKSGHPPLKPPYGCDRGDLIDGEYSTLI